MEGREEPRAGRAVDFSASIFASHGSSGFVPAFSIAASSIPAAQKSPTFCSVAPFGQSVFAEVSSRIDFRTARFRSASSSNEPHRGLVGGDGVAFSQLPSAYW